MESKGNSCSRDTPLLTQTRPLFPRQEPKTRFVTTIHAVVVKNTCGVEHVVWRISENKRERFPSHCLLDVHLCPKQKSVVILGKKLKAERSNIANWCNTCKTHVLYRVRPSPHKLSGTQFPHNENMSRMLNPVNVKSCQSSVTCYPNAMYHSVCWCLVAYNQFCMFVLGPSLSDKDARAE